MEKVIAEPCITHTHAGSPIVGAFNSPQGSQHQFPIQRPVLDRLHDVMNFDALTAF